MAQGKKTGGRQKGTPNKATSEMQTFADGLVSRPKYLAWLTRQFDAGSVSDKLQILMWHYAKGQPTKKVEHSGTVTLEEIVAGTRREDA
jgi:hypothetical protein